MYITHFVKYILVHTGTNMYVLVYIMYMPVCTSMYKYVLIMYRHIDEGNELVTEIHNDMYQHIDKGNELVTEIHSVIKCQLNIMMATRDGYRRPVSLGKL